MKTEDLKPDFKLPAKGKPDAGGKAKRVPLTPEQKEANRQKQLAQQVANRKRLKDLDPEERDKIFEKLGYYITGYLRDRKFSLLQAPFSFDYLGTDLVRHVGQFGFRALWDGTWKWPEGRELLPQLKKIARSKIKHIIRDWYYDERNIKMDNMTPSEETLVEKAFGLLDLDDEDDNWEDDAEMRDLGFKKAKNMLKKKPMYLAYVIALEEAHEYDYIMEELGFDTVEEVLRLEKKVLRYLASH